ncbi:Non-reducing end alpha-L-arabinofuranosidase BoGH43A [Colletotrichum aenigma]|uniref:Non-reducing end alpha-L-arabinofuranosidase BoGH43A n=1 Tax=Colletotrichum aenigma TaxID=1215731 RepID=UPI0018725291|nr:Non-reducing end alpha-L-arabinofuranosidase BoGH43A [Colletotrichum aenigma]KAF5521852.1 Non-reducing end alpha-L-arabinofuranosidase BoGH43A [Colletotrichum aenigma]
MAETKTFRSPIIPGFAPDPSVVFVGGVFYLATSSFHVFPGIPIYASTDLQEWKHIGNAINRKEQLSLERAETAVMPLDTGNIMVSSAGLFAPSIRHHEGRFYIICTNATRRDGEFCLENFYVSTADIWAGEWSDPIYFPFHGIDPSLFFDDDDGRAYVQGCWMIDRLKQPSCTIKQFEIDIATGKALSEVKEIWGGFAKYDTEGPHFYKRGEWYYLLVAEGGTFEHHMLSIGRSKSVWGLFESWEGNPIMTADGKAEYVQNVGHGELFQDGEGKWWAAVLGVRDEDGAPPLGRETFLTAVEWPEGGWPSVQQPRMEFQREVKQPLGPRRGLPPSPKDIDLVYIRDPDFDKYEFSGEGDERAFRLRASSSSISSPSGTATFVGKRQRAMDASALVRLDLSATKSGDPVVAGLALYKDALRHVSLAYDLASSRLVFDVTTTSEDKKQSVSLDAGSGITSLSFRAETSAKEYRFFYREKDGEDWKQAGSACVADLVAREMTGPIFGLFAHASGAEGVGKEARFDKFIVEGQKSLVW